MNTLYNRIKELANAKNVSLAQIERDMNFSNGVISTWKKGKASSEKVAQLAKYFDVSTDYLLGISDNEHGKVDLASHDAIYTYEGRKIPDEDLEVIRRLLKNPQK
jgi:transcriptional regulator with XRE-family HTH domain